MNRKHLYTVGVYLATIVAGVFCIMVIIFAKANHVIAQSEEVWKDKTQKNSYERLAGKWLRPDGGYILQLWDAGSKGTLKARYYNPKSINVQSASWQSIEGNLNVIIELRDVHYPGSTYNLRYDPVTDRLKGKYFQAVMGQTFEVEFVRVE